MPSPTQSKGARWEAMAERHLEQAGYQILERNWRGGGSEIDRIAMDGEFLCFVEVRARSRADYGNPIETIDRRKQTFIVRGAKAYIMRFPPGGCPMVRFDVVAIVDLGDGHPEIMLHRNAFDAGA